ncbi:MAG: NosD domain-containing protein, partial [bacterium]
TGGTILTGAGQVILAGCSNMIVENQDISGVYSGIAVGFGSGNMIRWNMVTDGYYGIYMYSSSGGTVSENTVTGGSYGIYLDSSNGGAVSGNTVTGSYYSTGISLRSSGSKTVSGNTVTDGYYGIRLYYSDSNTVSENIVANNLRYGILLSYSDSNTISHNDFVFNEYQLSNVGSTNTWNNPALEGNYWDDYDGLDDGTGGRTAGDGIGDTNLPHQGVDWYPLMTPYRWNYPPVVFITAPPSGALFPTGTPISFSGYFTDVEVEDTHEAIWSFDGIDVPGTVTESGGSGTVNDEIIFDTAGIYSVKLTVIDDKGGIGTADKVDGLLAQIVVYDPEGAFVTGGGWIHSPPDSYLYDYHATGKATFAFVAKYRKGADIPTGDTEFRFHVADFSFRSDSYDWLVCGGRKCKFKGSGTLTIKWKWGGPWDQEIPVGFMITAVDGDLHNGDGKDRFRIKIWEGDNEWNVIYDNMGLYWWDDDAEPPEIGGGSIVIHKG